MDDNYGVTESSDLNGIRRFQQQLALIYVKRTIHNVSQNMLNFCVTYENGESTPSFLALVLFDAAVWSTIRADGLMLTWAPFN